MLIKWALLTANGCIVDHLQQGSYTSGWMSYLCSLLVLVGCTSAVVAWQEAVLRRKLAAKCRDASAAARAAASSTRKADAAAHDAQAEPAIVPPSSVLPRHQKASSCQPGSDDDQPDEVGDEGSGSGSSLRHASGCRVPDASPGGGDAAASAAVPALREASPEQPAQQGDAQQQDVQPEQVAGQQEGQQREGQPPQQQLQESLAELGAEYFKRTSLYTPANAHQRMTLSIKVRSLAMSHCFTATEML
jgi:hypothetical protein